MPTGYTYAIGETPGFTFRDYALSCARAFGAMIHMRDDERGAPYRPAEASNYHPEALEKDKSALEAWQAMTEKAKLDEFFHHVTSEEARYLKTIEEHRILKEKYDAMLVEVQAWVPPTPEHENLKAFMIEQIQSSVRHDCDTEYYEEQLLLVRTLSFESWCAERLRSLNWGVEYHTKHLTEESARVDERNQWCQDLFDSLPEA